MTLDLSLGEFQALALKALRGAGYTWGQAEDGARAARALAASDLPAAAALCALLTSLPEAALCPICQGCALSDQGIDEEKNLQVVLPILLLPALGFRGFEMNGQGIEALAGPDGFTFAGPIDGQVYAVSIAPSRRTMPEARSSRARLSQSEFDQLQSFAHRTYAPATEESRLKGAG